ncbi:MAG: hypothetical protein NZ739_01180 [Verrucomicrobiae bacterium]|nr:hypothetical protein [Verrucomicrobiae bacterium]MCX7721523.1 hypothetical protein [Verrucomicrobiae bacterium]MDW7979241.1 hypothetical protein [Verrucomicrobiales bacterium]
MKSGDYKGITVGMTELEVRLYGSLIEQCVAEFKLWVAQKREDLDAVTDNDWIDFLKLRISQELRTLEELRQMHARFTRALGAARRVEDRRQIILDFARYLGSSPIELRKDAAAFARWFDADAVTDRYYRRHARREQYISFLLGRLGAVAQRVLRNLNRADAQMAFWNALQLEAVVKPLLVHDGDVRVCLAAFKCLATALMALAPELQEIAVDDDTLQYIYRSALQRQQQVWIQCAALELLVTLSRDSFERVLKQRLLHPVPGDDMFVRRKAVKLLAQNFHRLSWAHELVSAVFADPSPFVRQVLPQAIIKAPTETAAQWIEQLLTTDPSPQVRAAAWLEWPGLVADLRFRDHAFHIFRKLATQERDEFVLRVICLVAERCTATLWSKFGQVPIEWQTIVRNVLITLRCSAASLKVRRWASEALESVLVECDPDAHALRDCLAAFVRSIPPGRSRRLPRALSEGLDPVFFGRVWAVVCRHDYGVQLRRTRRGYVVARGNIFGFRWWRWLHEFLHPSPDKRQAFPHTIGRIFDGQMHVATNILAELAQTKVPGEPLYIPEEGGWRPYLPLLDEYVSAVELGHRAQEFRVFSTEGVTTVTPPRGLRRLLAAVKLTFKFREFAEKRNWREHMPEPPTSYLRALEKLGFKTRFEPYVDATGRPLPPDPAVTRFFPAFGALALLEDIWGVFEEYCKTLYQSSDRFYEYFVSLYQNSVLELAVFVIIFGLLFFGLHLYANLKVRFWRRRIPLVVGGWGTRGKSGTERLKAALFNALGFGVLSKTTGCEAMVLHAHPFGKLKEMFLFRPYDKATIWEQANVVRLAGGFNTDVLLWECMALRPSYVHVLQRSWMHDDISTITNTYPDHEDLQGPAGINIPEVIACFIPTKSTLVTSEEQMLPVLAAEAERCGTRVKPVTWLEAGLITHDVLQRFPYEEHPYNVALVLGLAEELGIDRDFAIKEIADRVVPDLGVLKTFPVATIRTRRLEFTNGMSANERFGTLSNWARTGFDRQDYIKEPGVWLTTVVNNRADRVPRSQVFARILVNDISADRHVLIGGNLTGLLGYIRDAWNERAPHISLWKDPSRPDQAEALRTLEQYAIQMRLPFSDALIKTHLKIMLSAQPQIKDPDALLVYWDQPEALKSHLAPLNLGEIETGILNNLQYELQIYREYQAFAERIRSATPGQAQELNEQFRELLQKWFNSKIIVVWDYYASGDEIIDLIARHTPPGFLNRIMGIQNIKGTGLDFVYRWLAWEACYKAAAPLRAEHVRLTPQLIAPLVAFNEFGVLCEEFVRETITRLKNSNQYQPPQLLAELDRVLERMDAALAEIRRKINAGGSRKTGWFESFLLRLEEFLDAGDAVRRRIQADRIYEDLVNERISRDRAAVELQALTQRQKGGWLLKKLEARRERKAAGVSGEQDRPTPEPRLEPVTTA